MTQEQFIKYERISKDIAEIESFLGWCGKKYHCRYVREYPIKLIKRKFSIGLIGSIKDTEIAIPKDLQDRIIDVIENYVDEKHKELEEI